MRGDRAKVSKGRSQSPLVVPERHETLTCGGYAATPCRLPQKEDHPQQWMVEDIPLRCSKALSRRKGLSSVSLTADCSLCRGSLLAPPPAKPPLKGEVPAIGGRRGSFPQRRQVTIPIVDAPTLRRNHLCRSPQVKRQPLFGREGSGGRGASLREAASPPSVPPKPRLFRRGPGGGGFSTEKHPPPEFHSLRYHTIAAISWMARSAWGTTVLLLRKQRMTGASLKMTPTSFVIPSSSPVLCAI